MTTNNLTELWKKDELEEGHYYLKDNEYIFIDHFNGVSFEETCDFEIKEVLAPVPSWEQWQQMKAFCEGFNTLEVSEENQKLKELLKECRETIDNAWMYSGIATPDAEAILTKIDEVLNVPSE